MRQLLYWAFCIVLVGALLVALARFNGQMPWGQGAEAVVDTQAFHDYLNSDEVIECPEACQKLSECELDERAEICDKACPDFYSLYLRDCISQSGCDFIEEDCFAGQNIGDCYTSCEKILACDLMNVRQCVDACSNWGPDRQECIDESSCEEIEIDCLAPDTEQTCDSVCERLIECSLWSPDQRFECTQECVAQMADTGIAECVFTAECEDIETWCFGETPAPQCGAYCDRLIECGQWDADEADACMRSCWYEPTELIQCVSDSDCETLDFCYSNPFSLSDCEDYCQKLIECEMYEPWAYLECWDSCQLEPAEVVWCAISAPCEQIEAVCWSNPMLDQCESACDFMLECGIESDNTICVEVCMTSWDEQTIGCAAEATCEQLEDECFAPDIDSLCEQTCAQLVQCGADALAEDCQNFCTAHWSIVLINCIDTAQCDQIEAACF